LRKKKGGNHSGQLADNPKGRCRTAPAHKKKKKNQKKHHLNLGGVWKVPPAGGLGGRSRLKRGSLGGEKRFTNEKNRERKSVRKEGKTPGKGTRVLTPISTTLTKKKKRRDLKRRENEGRWGTKFRAIPRGKGPEKPPMAQGS